MTREEAGKAAEVMLAYVNGEKIEYSPIGLDSWVAMDTPLFDWNTCKYRVKKEPTYRPFKDKEECWDEMQKHQPFGWVKNMWGSYLFVYLVSINGYVKVNDSENKFTDAFDRLTFVDGTPFGIKEE